MSTTTSVRPPSTGDGGRAAIDRLARAGARADRPRRRIVTSLIAFTVAAGIATGGIGGAISRGSAQAELVDVLGAADLLLPANAYELVLVDHLAATLTPVERATSAITRGSEPGPRDRAVDAVSVLGPALTERIPDGADILVWDQSIGFGYGADGPFVTNMDLTHPLAAGTFQTMFDGPLTGKEALASERWLALRGADVGDTVAFGDTGDVEIVGTVERTALRGQAVLVLAPGRPVGGEGYVRVDLPGTDGTDDDLARLGMDERSLFGEENVDDDGNVTHSWSLPGPSIFVDGELVLDAYTAGLTPEQVAALDTAPALLADHPEELARIAAHAEQFGPQVVLGPGTVIEADLRNRVFEIQTREPMTRELGDSRLVSGVTSTGVSVLLALLTGFVAAAAFTVGLRRRLREVGMLGAVGATPAQLARMLRREGVVLGSRGVLVGLVVGVGLVLAAPALVGPVMGYDLPASFPWLAVIAPPLAGLAAAAIAAAGPARVGSTVPVTTALAGRVPLGPPDLRTPLRGALVAAVGLGLIVLMRAGSVGALLFPIGVVMVLLGATSAVGLLVAVGGRFASRLPLAPRLALRDAARQRTRSVTAVGAVGVLLLLPLLATITTISDLDHTRYADDEWNREPLRSPFLEVAAEEDVFTDRLPSDDALALLLDNVPATGRMAELIPLGSVTWGELVDDGDGYGPYVEGGLTEDAVLATPELLEVLGLPADVVPAGGALILVDALQQPGPEDGEVLSLQPWGTQETVVPFATVEGTGVPAPAVIVDPAAAATLEGSPGDDRSLLVELDRRITQHEVNQLHPLVDVRGGREYLSYEWGGVADERAFELLAIAGVVLAVALLAAIALGMTAALAASESDGEIATIVALGGSPNVRRLIHGWLAWWYATLGGVLVLAVGGSVALALAGGVVEGLTFDQVRLVALMCAVVLLVIPPVVGVTVGLAMRRSPVHVTRRRT